MVFSRFPFGVYRARWGVNIGRQEPIKIFQPLSWTQLHDLKNTTENETPQPLACSYGLLKLSILGLSFAVAAGIYPQRLGV